MYRFGSDVELLFSVATKQFFWHPEPNVVATFSCSTRPKRFISSVTFCWLCATEMQPSLGQRLLNWRLNNGRFCLVTTIHPLYQDHELHRFGIIPIKQRQMLQDIRRVYTSRVLANPPSIAPSITNGSTDGRKPYSLGLTKKLKVPSPNNISSDRYYASIYHSNVMSSLYT